LTDTTPARLPEVVISDPVELFATFGIGDMTGLEGATDRIVKLSPTSDLECPLHELELRPDACRSCRFLAGEARR
jgi:hypothetical protein